MNAILRNGDTSRVTYTVDMYDDVFVVSFPAITDCAFEIVLINNRYRVMGYAAHDTFPQAIWAAYMLSIYNA